jgi:acyl carrier protein
LPREGKRVGMDSVEIVLRTEDEFSITLTDDEAGAVRTVDDLYKLVLSKLDLTPSCLSSKAFYRTRQALVASMQVARRSIRPSSDLESLVPESTRRQKWQEIADHIHLEFPRLQYPSQWRQRFFRIGALLSAFMILPSSTLAYRAFPGIMSGLALWIPALAAWVILFALINAVLQRYATWLQTELRCQTAGDLSRLVLTSNYEHFSPTGAHNTATSKEYVWKKLVEIICDQLQVGPEEVVPRASFVEDLGVD